MSDLRVRLLDLATRIGSEFKTVRAEIVASLATKQATLVSGTNIKTINGTSVLGSGDFVVAGGGSNIAVLVDAIDTTIGRTPAQLVPFFSVDGNSQTQGKKILITDNPNKGVWEIQPSGPALLISSPNIVVTESGSNNSNKLFVKNTFGLGYLESSYNWQMMPIKATLADSDAFPIFDTGVNKRATFTALKSYILTIPLVGWVLGSNTSVTSSDSISVSIGKLQAQVNAKSNTSHTHIASDITDFNTAAIAAVSTGAPALLDTLDELAAALGDDPNFATTMTTALGNRVRYDATQTLTAPQKTQACANIGIGEPDTDFVATFNTGLL